MSADSTLFRTTGTLVINPPVGEARFNRSHDQASDNVTDKPQSAKPLQQEIILRRGNSDSYAQADKFREQTQFQSHSNHQTAVNAYQSLAFESRREEIKQIMGVDTYA